MLITPTATQAYQLYLDTKYMKSVMVNSFIKVKTNGIAIADVKADYIDYISSITYIYKEFVDLFVYKVNSNYYYNSQMADSDDTYFAKLFIILNNALAKSSLIQTPLNTNIPLQ